MDFEDYVTAEVVVAVAATAAVISKRGRRKLRQAAVYGLAGALIAGGAAKSFGRGVMRGVRDTTGAGLEASSDQPAESGSN